MSPNALDRNLARLTKLETHANVKILHTLKSFNEQSILPLISNNLSGMSISSKKEFQMAKEASAKHIHLYAPAFKEKELTGYIDDVQSISFNSLGQWERFKHLGKQTSKGLRINPRLHISIPSHCNPNLEESRLGIGTEEFLKAFENKSQNFEFLEGLHFHALFQSSVEDLVLLLNYILEHFKEVLPQLKWLNLGGGHSFTNIYYDIDTFVKNLLKFQKLFPNITFYFEPGESVTKGCGQFICSILDIVQIAKKKIVILDTSIETHLLDIAIVNMKLKVKETQSAPTPYCYELTGNSCLQGDIIGQYFFTKELHIGDQVVFEDMMAYSMVKMTEFNGMEKANFYLDNSNFLENF
ncbi:MAG: Carboxynorspermidine decarboxylase, putative (EC [uncultured Sulfurovum sp.]|uniref:Carboxynorspermidine/carboxyspermidine decarboxylase n=1 Tax=uncultured Sulfurovum sp. TaxID=269237 RepID=A0A6S6TVF5_9BACT|nr:MAG: Carboxynorspermidine decarboxylase, putative (EC [uncultured Sulfurovum sp.]